MNILSITLAVLAVLLLSSCVEEEPRLQGSSENFCADVKRGKQELLSEYLAPIKDKMSNSTGVYVLEEETEAMMSRAWLSEHAMESIDVQYFIFSTDNIGLIAIDYLVKAAERGVKVRILVDDIMMQASGDELLMLAAHENLSIKIYNPLANVGKNIVEKFINLTTRFHDFNQRMHNKIFLVDGKITITGGRNIADEYFGFDHEYNFRDRDVLLIGGVNKAIAQSFEQFWQDELSVPVDELMPKIEFSEADLTFNTLHQYACNPENFTAQIRVQIKNITKAWQEVIQTGKLHWLEGVEYVSDQPGKNNKDKFLSGSGQSTERLIELVQQAKESIVIQTPYLITTKTSRTLFKSMVDKGVAITILTNSLASNDNLEAFSGYQRDRSALLKTGVKIYEFKPDAQIRQKIMSAAMQEKLAVMPIFGLHAKSMVIDDNTTVIGTFNLDPRSSHLNTESIVIIPSKQIAAEVKQGMLVEMQPENAWQVTLTWNPDHKVSALKQLKVKMRIAVPKNIL